MTLRESGPCQVPPGFRFHPTDEELVNYYLRKKLAPEKFDLEVIRDVDLNKLEPWDLRERCRIDSAQQAEWYFFSHKDKKYPTGTRTNRATAAGFWKATGRDKAVHSSYKRIGMRKTLVFYTGRAPHGQKTDWIMHEYRLEDYETGMPDNEDWVVCRVFKKRILQQKSEHSQSLRLASEEDQQSSLVDSNLEYYKSTHVDGNNTATDLSFYCKQEASDLDEFDLPRAPFLHLPQLESPKHTSLTAFSNVSDRGKGIFSEINYCNRPEFPSPFSLEMPGLESNCMAKSLFSCDDNLSDSYGDSGQMNYGWSILETIPKGEKYSSEFSDIAPLPLLASRVHQQAIDQYLPTCSSEADLWNFIS